MPELTPLAAAGTDELLAELFRRNEAAVVMLHRRYSDDMAGDGLWSHGAAATVLGMLEIAKARLQADYLENSEEDPHQP